MVPPFDEDKQAVTHRGDFSLWAWSSRSVKITGIQYTVCPEDEGMKSFRKEKIT